MVAVNDTQRLPVRLDQRPRWLGRTPTKTGPTPFRHPPPHPPTWLEQAGFRSGGCIWAVGRDPTRSERPALGPSRIIEIHPDKKDAVAAQEVTNGVFDRR